MNHNLKQKLEAFVIEELNINFNAKINKGHGQEMDDENIDEIYGEDDDEYDNLPFMSNNKSFDSNDDQNNLNSP